MAALRGVIFALLLSAASCAPLRVPLGKARPGADHGAVAGTLARWWRGPANEEGVVPLLNYLDAQVRTNKPRTAQRARTPRALWAMAGGQSPR